MKIIKLCIFLLAIPALSYAFGFGGGGGGGRGVQTGTPGNYGLSMADNGASSFTCGDSIGHLFWEGGVLKFCNPNSTTKITIGESGSSSDTTPDAFAFTDETGIAISTAKTSNAITVAGINSASAISVTGDTGYGYSKNSAACTATSGTVVAGDTVAACVTSSGSNSTATTSTVTIGGVSDTYSVTTVAGSATYSDSFAYANGTLTTLNTNWTVADGCISPTVTSNYAYAPLTAVYGVYWSGNVISDNQWSQASYKTGSNNGGAAVRLAKTSTGTAAGYYAKMYGTSIKLYRIDGTTYTQIGTTYTATIADGDIVKIAVTDSTITAYHNGSLVITATDNTYTTGGVGIFLPERYNSLDNWSGGSL